VGTGLTPTVAAEYAAVYGQRFAAGRQVLVARDSRPTSRMMAQAVIAGLAAAGCTPVDVGMAATPTCGLLVRYLHMAGAVMVTASHNPPEWNGLKLFHPAGRVLAAAEGQRVLDAYNARRWQWVDWERVGQPSQFGDPHSAHADRVLAVVDAAKIRQRAFHVVVDANHGVGGILATRLFSALGCRCTMLGGKPDGRFEHPPEPVPQHLRSLCDTVREVGAAVGFAQDPDADRLAIVDQTGRPIGEEYTITLAVYHLLATRAAKAERKKRKVVVNLSTTRAVDDVASRFGAEVIRTPVGEANVVEAMVQSGAMIGGEGNGGVIHPDVVLVRDSFTAMALVLEAMAVHDVPVSTLVERLPKYHMVKTTVTVGEADVAELLKRLRRKYRTAAANTADGLRLDWPDRWVHVRPSNTEPLVRVIAEATERESAARLAEEVCGRLKELAGESEKPSRRRPAAAKTPKKAKKSQAAQAKRAKTAKSKKAAKKAKRA